MQKKKKKMEVLHPEAKNNFTVTGCYASHTHKEQ